MRSSRWRPRALSIAFFYAAGTAVGGIAGPLLFGHLIASGSQDQVATGFFIGAAVMAIGGIAELLFGVRAEQRALEDIAKPLTAEEAEGAGERAEGAEPEWIPAQASEPVYIAGSRGLPLWAPGETSAVRKGEIEALVRVLRDQGSATRRELGRGVNARRWGPGRFQGALREAVRGGQVKRLRRDRYSSSAEPDEPVAAVDDRERD